MQFILVTAHFFVHFVGESWQFLFVFKHTTRFSDTVFYICYIIYIHCLSDKKAAVFSIGTLPFPENTAAFVSVIFLLFHTLVKDLCHLVDILFCDHKRRNKAENITSC